MLTHARLAVYLDLDVEVLPSWSLRLLPAAVGAPGVEAEARKTAEDWMHLLRCADTRRWALLSLPDHTQPCQRCHHPAIYLPIIALGAVRCKPVRRSAL